MAGRRNGGCCDRNAAVVRRIMKCNEMKAGRMRMIINADMAAKFFCPL